MTWRRDVNCAVILIFWTQLELSGWSPVHTRHSCYWRLTIRETFSSIFTTPSRFSSPQQWRQSSALPRGRSSRKTSINCRWQWHGCFWQQCRVPALPAMTAASDRHVYIPASALLTTQFEANNLARNYLTAVLQIFNFRMFAVHFLRFTYR